LVPGFLPSATRSEPERLSRPGTRSAESDICTFRSLRAPSGAAVGGRGKGTRATGARAAAIQLRPRSSPRAGFVSPRRRDSLSAGRLQPPPARPFWRRRHRPAPGRSPPPPPHPPCRTGGASAPPRGTCCARPELRHCLRSDPYIGPFPRYALRPVGNGLSPELLSHPWEARLSALECRATLEHSAMLAHTITH
jgi:hypothetical protein